MIPALAAEGLADAVDAFCEGIAFSPAEVARVFEAARRLGLPVKLHADQLSNGGGAALAAEFGALSADHLEYADEAGVAAMAARRRRRGPAAGRLLLPARDGRRRRSRSCASIGVPMAVATDCNPGTSPLTSLLLTMNMARDAVRPHGRRMHRRRHPRGRPGARRRLDETGTLEAGKWCDLAIWDIERPAELVYRMGFNPLHARVWRGQ